MNLLLKKDDIEVVPDEIFESSPDLQNAIRDGHVMCEGKPHKGRIVKFDTPIFTQMSREPSIDQGQNIETRINILERSVSTLLKKDYQIPITKYEDYAIYSNTFISSAYDAMVFDMFLDNSKTESSTVALKHGCLTTANDGQFFTFNSKEFKLDAPIVSIFPMARWEGDGHLIVEVNKKIVLNTAQTTNLLWSDIPCSGDSIGISVSLSSKYNKIALKSYCILAKLERH